MRDFCALTTATLVFVLALTSDAAGQEWQTVTSPDGSFTVEMPGKALYFREEMKTANGTPFILHQYLVDLGADQSEVTYIVQGGAYPSDFDISDPKSMLEETLSKGAKGVDGGEWSSVEWGTQQGAMTAEGLGVKGETDKRNFSAVKGRNFYDLVYWGPRGTAMSPDANRFFSSLKIGGEAPQRDLPSMRSTPLERDRP